MDNKRKRERVLELFRMWRRGYTHSRPVYLMADNDLHEFQPQAKRYERLVKAQQRMEAARG